MNITITTAPEYYGDDCTADLIKYAATLADSYVGDDLELATITATVRVPSYGPAYPAVPVSDDHNRLLRGRCPMNQSTMGGRYYLRAYLRGAEVNRSAQLYGWEDLADALLRACELAEDASRDCAWIIADRVDQVDLVRVDITERITYLA